MDILKKLASDHGDLRRRIKEIQGFLQRHGGPSGDRLGESSARELFRMQKTLAEALKAHEREEERFMAETLVRAGAEAEPLIKAVEGDHKSLGDLLRILDTMSDVRTQHSAYSIRFTSHSLAYALERHLSYEEQHVFPLIARLMAGARSA